MINKEICVSTNEFLGGVGKIICITHSHSYLRCLVRIKSLYISEILSGPPGQLIIKTCVRRGEEMLAPERCTQTQNRESIARPNRKDAFRAHTRERNEDVRGARFYPARNRGYLSVPVKMNN